MVLSLWVDSPEEMAAVGRRLETEPSLSAVELAVPAGRDAKWLTEVIASFHTECELPLLVKLPLTLAPELVTAAEEAEAEALVLATPHFGRAPGDQSAGPLYGPGILPYTLQALASASRSGELPLIASGGIYDMDDAAACHAAGAIALQLDGLLFIDPAGAGRLAAALAGGLVSLSASE